MPLWTTYLANWANHKEEILKAIEATSKRKAALLKFVMRNRGNDEVAPTKEMLTAYKKGEITWEQYEKRYNNRLLGDLADEWVFDVIQDLKAGIQVLLICYEKDPNHCHRRLLAEWIENYDSNIDYRGEITLEV